jgi:AsmA protein
MRWFVRLLSLLLMLVLLVAGLLALVPARKVAELAAAEFGRATGRSLTIGGGVRPMLWPVVGVTARQVTVSNVEGSREGPLFTADEVEIGLDTAALIAGEVRITSLIARTPRIVLERGPDGVGNWQFAQTGGAGAQGTPGAGRPFSLGRGALRDGTVIFLDHATGRRVEITGLDLQAEVPAFDGPAEVSATAALAGQPVRLELWLADFATTLGGRVAEARLSLEAGAARLRFDGRAGLGPPAAEGALEADLADLTELSRLAGIDRPALPQGLGAGGVQVAGHLTLTPESTLHLRQGRVVLDGQALEVEADLRPGPERPRLSAVLRAGALDLRGLAAAGAGGGAGGPGWSQDPIRADALGALDADISLRAEAVDLGWIALGPTRAGLAIDRARAVLDLREAAAYGGSITGTLVANARGGFSARADLVLSELDLQPLLQALAGYDRLSGRGTLRVSLLSSGGSVDALMRGLSGEGSLALGEGALRGLDLVEMLRRLDPDRVGEGDSTIFDRLVASFRIDGGVLANDDLALSAPLVTATGAGQVDLARQSLDYRLRPTALPGADGQGGVLVPLVISGPWAAPKFRLDLQALADEKLAAERAELEARARAEAERLEAEARARLEEKARDALGVTVQEGETPAEALERRAREALEAEAERALERLLGGN